MELMQLFSLIGFTFDLAGKVMIAFTAIMVHHRFREEHKIDAKVFRAMKRENFLGIVGLVLIIAGFILQLPLKL